jgi:hypothetical protein
MQDLSQEAVIKRIRENPGIDSVSSSSTTARLCGTVSAPFYLPVPPVKMCVVIGIAALPGLAQV